MRLRARAGLTVALAAAVTGSGAAVSTTAADGQNPAAAVRAATAKYHQEARAIADGYRPTSVCVPGMGYHYVNLALFGAPLDPLRPAALIYAPHGKNGRKLIAVEYFVVDSDQDVRTHNAVRPTLFGKQFDGPMPGHEPGMPVHYDLHFYVWTTNPDGALATWNPEVTCP